MSQNFNIKESVASIIKLADKEEEYFAKKDDEIINLKKAILEHFDEESIIKTHPYSDHFVFEIASNKNIDIPKEFLKILIDDFETVYVTFKSELNSEMVKERIPNSSTFGIGGKDVWKDKFSSTNICQIMLAP